MDLPLFRPADTGENQLITNFKAPHPSPQSPTKKEKFVPENCFSAQIYLM